MSGVGVNLLWCVPGAVGGSEEYLTRQLVGLADREDAPELVLLVLRGFREAHPELADRFPTVAAPTDGHRRASRIALESTWLASRTRHHRFDLVHHGGGTMPLLRAAPGVLTVHDLQYLTYPEFFRLSKLTYLRSAVPASVRRAVVVTVPSEYVRGVVAEATRYPAERIVVVPHGLDPAVGAAPADLDVLRRRLGLHDDYLVYPAVTHPHKNHGVLLEAMAALRRMHPDLRLVLLGAAGLAEHDVEATIERLAIDDVVVRPGRVPPDEPVALVQGAAALVFPSRYEGFGAPVIEAMHLGTPVLAAATTALPEVVGDAGVLLDPLDTDAWVVAIDELLRDPIERAQLVASGRARAAEFTAARSAAALLAAYRLARPTTP